VIQFIKKKVKNWELVIKVKIEGSGIILVSHLEVSKKKLGLLFIYSIIMFQSLPNIGFVIVWTPWSTLLINLN